MIVSFLLHFCSGHLQLSHLFLQYSVPRSAFKDSLHSLHVWSVYPRSRPEMPKIVSKDCKRVEVLEEGAASPLGSPHQLWDLGSAVIKLHSGQQIEFDLSVRGHSPRYRPNNCTQFEISS